jgi:hypothetical protein
MTKASIVVRLVARILRLRYDAVTIAVTRKRDSVTADYCWFNDGAGDVGIGLLQLKALSNASNCIQVSIETFELIQSIEHGEKE